MDRAGEGDVLGGRVETARRMVVDEDEAEGEVRDRGVEDLARVGAGRVQGADRDRLAVDQAVLRVEVEADEVLLLGAREIACDAPGFLRARDARSGIVFAETEAPAQLERGREARGLRLADALLSPPFLRSQTTETLQAVAAEDQARGVERGM